jgi:hypothetical protein
MDWEFLSVLHLARRRHCTPDGVKAKSAFRARGYHFSDWQALAI